MNTAKLIDKSIKFTFEDGQSEFDGQKLRITHQPLKDQPNTLQIYTDQESYRAYLVSIDLQTKTVELLINQESYELQIQSKLEALLEEMGIDINAASGMDELKAPMPGKVVDLMVQEGDEVEEGTPLVILEAMKMENVLKAEAATTIKAINIKKGDTVDKNASLIEFDMG